MGKLDGKTVLVTGATRGIGKGIVESLADEGANIAFTYMSSEDLAKGIESDLQSRGVKAKAYRSNAANFEEAEKLVASVIEEFGSLDVLINNAGITQDNLLMRMNEEMWDNVLETNLKSCFNTVKASNRQMMKQRAGSIINITSVVGIKGNAGQSNYAASKAGIIGFTKSVALELGSRNIRCNAVAPGFIETEMTEKLDQAMVDSWKSAIPLKRGGTPEDVAKACVFLASEDSAYITGQVLQVDGGMLT